MARSSAARPSGSARLSAQAQKHGGSAHVSAQDAAVPRAIAAELARQASRPASTSERPSKRQRVQSRQGRTGGDGGSTSKLTAKAEKAKQEELRKTELQQQILRLTQELAHITENGQQAHDSEEGEEEQPAGIDNSDNDDASDDDNDPNYSLFVPSGDADGLSGDRPPSTGEPTEENLTALEQLQQQRLAEQEERARNPPPANESRHDKAAREQRQEFEELRIKLRNSRDPFAKPLRECMDFFEDKAAAMELESGQRAKIMEVRSPASVSSTDSVNYTVEDIMSVAPDDSDIAAWASDAILDVKINVVNAKIRQHKAYIANIAELGMFIFRDDENGYYANDGEALDQREGETGLEARTRNLIAARNAAIDEANDPTNARANPFDPSLYPAGHMPADTTRLLLPYNISNSHWVLVEVEVDDAKTQGHVRLYNTLGGGSRRGNSYATVQRELPGILQLIQRRPDLGWDRVQFGEIPEVKSCPQQDNSTDCGFWSIFLAEQLAKSEPLSDGAIKGVKNALRGKALRWEVMKDIYHHLLNKQLAGQGPLEPAGTSSGSGKGSKGSKGPTGSGGSNNKSARQPRHPRTPGVDDLDPEANASDDESLKTWKQFDDYRFDLRQMICDLLEEDDSYYSQDGILDEITTRVQALATTRQANIAGQESVIRERACAILERSHTSFMMVESLTPEEAAVEEIVTEGGPWYRLSPNPVHSVSTAAKTAFLSTPERAPELLDPIRMEFKLSIPVVRDSGAQRYEESFQTFRTRSKDQLVSFHNAFGSRSPLPKHVQTWDDMLEHGLAGSFWTDYVFSGSSRDVLFGRNSTGQAKDTGRRLRRLLTSLNAWAQTQGIRQRVSLLYSCTDGGTSNNHTWPEIQEKYPAIDFYVVIVQPSSRCWNPAYFLVNEEDDNCWAAFEVEKLADLQRGQHVRDAQSTARLEDLPEYRFMVSANLIQYFKDDQALRPTTKDELHIEPYSQNRLAAQLTGNYRKSFGLSEATKECEVCHVVSDEHGASSTLTWSRGSSTDVAVVCDNHIDAVYIQRKFVWRGLCLQLSRELLDPFAKKTAGRVRKPQKNRLSRELKTRLGSRPYACTHTDCGQSFETRSILSEHILTHSSDHPHACTHPGCDKRFKSQQDLSAHVATHTDERTHVCTHPGCGKDFRTATQLSVHATTHSDERPYTCTYPSCSKGFKTNSQLKVHLKTHADGRSHACTHTDCGKSFKTRNSLNMHLKTHSENRPHACTHPDCGETFKTAGHLRKHQKTHANNRTHVDNRTNVACTHPGCGQSFKTAAQLDIHASSHSGDRPHACSHPGCGKTYKTGMNLSKHQKTHSDNRGHVDNRTHACIHPGCGERFMTAAQLNMHVSSHSDDRPHACSHPGCGRTFKTTMHLARHQKTHSEPSSADGKQDGVNISRIR
jgi:KRAB domain-containing zinc finger protein